LRFSKSTLEVLALTLAASGCVPIATPPIKGGGGFAVRAGDETNYRFYAGAHVASVVPQEKFPLDVGVGYVQQGSISNDKHLAVHGLYLDGGPRMAGGKHWRVFMGPRAEYYFLPSAPGAGYAAFFQTSVEGFVLVHPSETDTTDDGDPPTASVDASSNYWGVAIGALAIGLDLMGGYQSLPAGEGLPTFGAGLHVRLPATAGLACCAWDFAKK